MAALRRRRTAAGRLGPAEVSVDTLDTAIDRLADLDALRHLAGKYQEAALQALTAKPYAGGRDGWANPGDLVEVALLLRALAVARTRSLMHDNSHDKTWNATRNTLVEKLKALKSSDLFEKGDDEVPMLRTARCMQALVLAGEAFSCTGLRCYYRIVRELYSADAPDWSTGGARASDEAASTAFVTGECVRAVLTLVRTFEATARYLKMISDWSARLSDTRIPAMWLSQEHERYRVALWTGLAEHRYKTLHALDGPSRPSDTEAFVAALPTKLLTAINADLDNIRSAIKDCQDWHDGRENAKDTQAKATERAKRKAQLKAKANVAATERRAGFHHLDAHDFAVSVLADAAAYATEVKEALEPATTNWKRAANAFTEGAAEIRRVLHPAEYFLESVLDRELANAADPRRQADFPELSFAAASYGALRYGAGHEPTWHDFRLARAAEHLANALSDRGLVWS
jgi:hypothetical protein